MKGKIHFLMTGLLMLVFAFSLTQICYGLQTEEAEEITITGTVTPVEWDEDDNVTAVAISVVIESEDESVDEVETEEYRVVNDEIGQKLLKLEGQTVEATGKIETDEEENKLIHVSSFKVIEEK